MINDALIQKERELGLLLALDRARDAKTVLHDPESMLHEIISLLVAYFEADACALLLFDEDGVQIESVIRHGVDEVAAVDLCRQASRIQTPAPLDTNRWPYSLGLQVLLREGELPLGSLFIARSSVPFDIGDTNLLRLAEGQIDSAIEQTRAMLRLFQRNRELEAIRRIDRQRDEARDETELINSCSALVTEFLNAELCLVFVRSANESDLRLRGLSDQYGVNAEQLSAVRNAIMSMSQPTKLVIEGLGTGDAGLALLAFPFDVAGESIGTLVVGRVGGFDVAARRLLRSMAAQMDSALAHSRALRQLQQRQRELEAIYRIDHIRDTESDFDTMLQKVLTELCRAVSSEIGYLMLYNARSEAQLDLRAATSNDLLQSSAYIETIRRVSRQALQSGEAVTLHPEDGDIRSLVAVPLILNQTVIGVFGAINSQQGFDEDDQRILSAITSQVDTAVFERLEQRRMRSVLKRSVDPNVINHLLTLADEEILAGERVVLTALFADMRGSTEWTERTEPEELVRLLNMYLLNTTEVIFQYGGTLDKFVGDEVIALFGSPVKMADHAYQAAQAALMIQAQHRRLQASMAAQGREVPPIGVGIGSGEVIAGEFGPPIRTDFTAMGQVMNLGSRLCGVAGPGEIYISQATRDLLADRVEVRPLEPISLKGIGEPVPVYELLTLRN